MEETERSTTTETSSHITEGDGKKPVSSRRGKRARSIPCRMKRWQKELLFLEGIGLVSEPMPRTRGECPAERPCPFVRCRYHLYIDVNEKIGTIKLNFPGLEVWELTDTCALDVADRGGVSLDDIGVAINITRERVRQLILNAISKIIDKGPEELSLLAELADAGQRTGIPCFGREFTRDQPPREFISSVVDDTSPQSLPPALRQVIGAGYTPVSEMAEIGSQAMEVMP